MRPGSPEWLATITASKVAAIVGASRWESPYSLWHRMAGNRPPEPPRDEFTAGHAFEHALAAIWKAENPEWRLSREEVQVRTDAFGFPAAATLDRRASRGRARRVVEFKTARSLEDWGDDFTDNVPDDYLMQVTWQMGLTGWTRHPAHLMVMGPFFRWHTYEVPFDEGIFSALVDRAARFHSSLAAGEPPALDDSVPTYRAVREVHPDISPGTTCEVPVDLARDYLTAVEGRKAADVAERGAKTRLLDLMGDTELARTDGGLVVARRSARGKAVTLTPTTKTLKEIAA